MGLISRVSSRTYRNLNSIKMMRRFLTTQVRTMAAEASTGMNFTFSCPADVHYQNAANVNQIDLPTGPPFMNLAVLTSDSSLAPDLTLLMKTVPYKLLLRKPSLRLTLIWMLPKKN